jgi:hypothetical protein
MCSKCKPAFATDLRFAMTEEPRFGPANPHPFAEYTKLQADTFADLAVLGQGVLV